jgi:hypothetical protein
MRSREHWFWRPDTAFTTPDAPPEKRILLEATSHFPLKAGFLLSGRNRADLDWKNGSFTWCYRNKLTLERTVAIGSYRLIPYVLLKLSARVSTANGAPLLFLRAVCFL